MDEQNSEVEKIQADVKKEMESGDLSKKINNCEKERLQFEAINARVSETQLQIKTYMEKFDNIKNEVEQNNTKFTTITTDIETKRVQAQLIQT